jgi:hypothetical protein
MNIVDLNNKATIDFKSNQLPDNESIKSEKLLINEIDINNSKEDFTASAKLIYNKLLTISNTTLSLSDKGSQANDWVKRSEINPQIEKNMNSVIKYLKNSTSNVLSIFTLRRDTSSLDITQWGKGAEFVTKYGLLPKAGLNTTNILTNSYEALCKNMNEAQSLQLRLSIIGLGTSWDASSFSVGFDKVIQQQTESGTLMYGFVKGLATAYNNAGDFKIHEVLDSGKTAIGFQDDEVLNTVPDPSKYILDLIGQIFSNPLNLVYILSLYEKVMKYNLTENLISNLAIKQNINNDSLNTDYRGTPIDNKVSTSEGILT